MFDIIKFIEDTLEIEYRGYSSEQDFIDELYCAALIRDAKKRGLRNDKSKRGRKKSMGKR